eukprot:7753293-Pyramimonas_sp.AAC.1
MCVALRRELHLKTTRPPSVKLLRTLKTKLCSALRREPHVKSYAPSIREAVAHAKQHQVMSGERVSNVRPALPTRLGVRQGRA